MVALSKGLVINERYELESEISRGGMGEVWIAKDLILDRFVAVKTVNSVYLKENPKASIILYDEAKTGATLLGHPNVVSVLDFGDFNDGNGDTNYIVMEYVEGVTVSKWINEIRELLDKKTYYRVSLLIAWELCKALEYAHERDITP